jgi:hypothetical protein
MRAIYINKANRAKILNIRSSKKYIELADGYHVIPPKCIYKERGMKDDSLCIILEGRVLPYGDVQAKESIELLNWEIFNTFMMKKRVDVDSQFSRILAMILKNIVPIGMAVILIGVGISVMQGG